MKYSLRRKYVKFINSSEYSRLILKTFKDTYQEKESTYIINGCINNIWQLWNSFWREYWLVYYYGGDTIKSKVSKNQLRILDYQNNCIEGKAIAVITHNSKDVNYYQEPTWGSTKYLTKISSDYSTVSSRCVDLLSALSYYSDSIDDIQAIRNNSIHLSKGGLLSIRDETLLHGYNINRNDIKYPTDLLFCTKGRSQRFAFDDILDDLLDVINHVFIANGQ